MSLPRTRTKRDLDDLKAAARVLAQLAPTLPRVRDMLVARHWAERRRDLAARNPLLAAGAKHYSQNDEDGLIAEILRRLGRTTPGTFVELGVGDGTENNTLLLLLAGWRGLWLGGEALAFEARGRLRFSRCWITAESVVDRVRAGLEGWPTPTLASLDLDGNDWWIARTLLDHGLRPAVWIVEYNGKLPPPISWAMTYDPDHVWRGGDHFGASLQRFAELFDRHGYRLVCCNITGANAFFVRRDAVGDAFDDVPDDVGALFVPPDYNWFVGAGHPVDVRIVEQALLTD